MKRRRNRQAVTTNQEQAPPGRHESKDAHEDVKNRHVGNRRQDDDDGDECYEYQPLDQPEHELELRAEPPPAHGHGLPSKNHQDYELGKEIIIFSLQKSKAPEIWSWEI